MILGYSGGPNFITGDLIIRGRQENQCQRRRCDNGRGGQSALTAGRRPGAKEYRWPLEARKDKEIDFPQECPEGTQSCQHLDFKTVKSISDY